MEQTSRGTKGEIQFNFTEKKDFPIQISPFYGFLCLRSSVGRIICS